MTINKRNLVLVMPPQQGLLSGFATGLISLANYVEHHVIDVQIDLLDLSAISIQKIENQIKNSISSFTEELFVGITTTTASYQSALAVSSTFKKINPTCKIILGGHHAGADAENVLRSHVGLVDFVIVGEGERSLVDLLNAYPSYFSVPGLAFLNREIYFENPIPPLLEVTDLDLLPIRFRDNGLMSSPGKFDHATYVSARGCPLKCAFCSVANQRIRAKSVSQVIQDIEELLHIGISRIAIEDNFFAHSPSRTRELCLALVDLQLKRTRFRWDCQTRVESMVHEWIVPLMEDAGCEAVYLGVESLNKDQLLYLRKTSHPDKYLDLLFNAVVPRLLNSRIDCYINIQLGLPGENTLHDHRTLESLQRLGKIAHDVGKTITIFPQLHVVYPGTPHFKMGIEQGRFPVDVFESFTLWEAEHAPVRTWLGEHFAHGTGGLPEGILFSDEVRRGQYFVNSEEVCRISTILKRFDRIQGIKVFNYGSYLVEEKTGEEESNFVYQSTLQGNYNE